MNYFVTEFRQSVSPRRAMTAGGIALALVAAFAVGAPVAQAKTPVHKHRHVASVRRHRTTVAGVHIRNYGYAATHPYSVTRARQQPRVIVTAGNTTATTGDSGNTPDPAGNARPGQTVSVGAPIGPPPVVSGPFGPSAPPIIFPPTPINGGSVNGQGIPTGRP